MFLHKTNGLMRALYPNFTWKMPAQEKKIYLTFDDGPIPEITEFVLETLAKYEAKATFFCIGGNVEKHPDIFKKILLDKHSVGNHTFNHLNGWDSENDIYAENVVKCKTELLKNACETTLFRPPYGRIKRQQAKRLMPDYEVIMWDVLSGDFSQSLSSETVLRKTIKYTEAGSIVLFHDSIKANERMSYALPRFLEHFSTAGFQFSALQNRPSNT